MRRDRGFTLLEVMLALAILFSALVVLVGASNANVKASVRAKFMTVATGLARAKMLDLQEELLHKGFQDTAETMDGDFSDEGYPKYTWAAKIEKIELPGMNQMQDAAKEAAESAGGESKTGGAGGLGGYTGMPGGAGAGASPSNAMGAAIISSQFEMLKGILENALRKVTLTMKWKAGGEDQVMVVVTYYTDPKAVDAQVGTGGGAPPPPGGTN